MADIFGDDGDNVLIGTSDSDMIDGGDGNDTIRGAEGGDDLRGGAGNDTITGGSGDDTIHGGDGTDTISFVNTAGWEVVDLAAGFAYGQADYDTLNSIENIVGSAYDDDLYGDETANSIWGGAGIDFIFGRFGDDSLYGGDDRDLLVGDLGADTIDGGRGGDYIYGGDGNDVIHGGSGGDRISGGAKSDTFVYTVLTDSSPTHMDLITDLKDGKDFIDVSFIDADSTTEGNQAFHQVEAFTGAAGEMMMAYDPSTGRTTVSFDADGDGTADMAILLKGDHSTSEGWLL